MSKRKGVGRVKVFFGCDDEGPGCDGQKERP